VHASLLTQGTGTGEFQDVNCKFRAYTDRHGRLPKGHWGNGRRMERLAAQNMEIDSEFNFSSVEERESGSNL